MIPPLPTRPPVSFLAHSFSGGSTKCHTPRASIHHISPRSLPLFLTPYRCLLPTPFILNLFLLPPPFLSPFLPPSLPSFLPPTVPPPVPACLPLFLPVFRTSSFSSSFFYPSFSSSLSYCSSDPTSITTAPPVPNLALLPTYLLLQKLKKILHPRETDIHVLC